jgi:hypothetical protein
LFAGLDLGRPGLEAVAAAGGRGDRPAARHALAEYYRHRARPDTARAERALRHEFESIGCPHMFGPVIDRHFDKTAEPGSSTVTASGWVFRAPTATRGTRNTRASLSPN